MRTKQTRCFACTVVREWQSSRRQQCLSRHQSKSHRHRSSPRLLRKPHPPWRPQRKRRTSAAAGRRAPSAGHTSASTTSAFSARSAGRTTSAFSARSAGRTTTARRAPSASHSTACRAPSTSRTSASTTTRLGSNTGLQSDARRFRGHGRRIRRKRESRSSELPDWPRRRCGCRRNHRRRIPPDLGGGQRTTHRLVLRRMRQIHHAAKLEGALAALRLNSPENLSNILEGDNIRRDGMPKLPAQEPRERPLLRQLWRGNDSCATTDSRAAALAGRTSSRGRSCCPARIRLFPV